jgi:DNA-binding CsgD family transcriptional regulator
VTTTHSDATLQALIDSAFACVTDPPRWGEFLALLREVTDSDRAVLHGHWNIEGDSGGVIAIGMDPGAMSAHRAHYWQREPWAEARRRLRNVPPVVYPHRYKTVPDSEYFQDWMRPWRIFDDACLTLPMPDGRPSPGLSVGYADADRLYTAEDERLFVALVPHLARALYLTRRFEKQRIAGEHAAYDAGGVGVVELSPARGIVGLNDTARHLLMPSQGRTRRQHGVLAAVRGGSGLSFAHRDTQVAFERALADALTPRLGSAVRSWFRIGRTGGRALVAFVSAVPHGWFADRSVRLYVLDPHNGIGNPTDTWRVLWQFTPSECRVAEQLMSGSTAAEIAAASAISVHAVRFHIKSMLAKTQTRRQAELLLVLSRTAHLNPPEPSAT